MAQHSSIVGGSTAGRLIACPASYQATVTLPPSTDIASVYADEGTAMHAMMEKLMKHWHAWPLTTFQQLVTMAFKMIGEPLYQDIAYTKEHHDTMIVPALAALQDLMADYGGDFYVQGVERRVRFPGIHGAFGTVDLIIANDHTTIHVDWKFGAGVPVAAVVAGDINSQLLFYVTAARHTLNRAMTCYGWNRTLIGAIIQPRADSMLSHAVIADVDIARFRKRLVTAVDVAMSRGPQRHRGEHCRFAPCKLTCHLWTGPLLDLTALAGAPVKPPAQTTREPTAFGEYLAKAKLLLDQAALFKKEVDDQMHAYLAAGGSIPGWRLKAKAKQRQWVDIDTVEAALRQLGFADEEIWTPKLNTFSATDAVAKRLGVTIPDNLRVAPPSTETTLATTDDPAPVVDRALAAEQFAAALKQLKAGAS